MISPITSRAESYPLREENPPFNPVETPSSLSSMQENKVVSFFQRVIHFFCWLFCCGRCWSTHVSASTIPEISLASFEKEDPFVKLLGNFRDKTAFRLTGEIFDEILGQSGPIGWAYQKDEIESRQLALESSGIHPLEFLYYIFMNEEKTRNIHNFKEHSQGRALEIALKIAGTRKNPWEEFLEKQGLNFSLWKEGLPPLLPGFCSALHLDLVKVKRFQIEEQWENLIRYIFKERKNHFKIS